MSGRGRSQYRAAQEQARSLRQPAPAVVPPAHADGANTQALLAQIYAAVQAGAK